MERFLHSLFVCLLIMSIGNSAECRTKKIRVPKQTNAPQIVVNDFRHANKLDTFYYFDKNKNKYIFVPVGFKNYIRLSKENKKIYNDVKKANKLMSLSQKVPFKTAKMNLGQTAFQKNPDLIPVAYQMSEEFKKDKKYSTALYYAQKVQDNDKKNRFRDISVKTGELNYQLGNYFKAEKDLNVFVNSSYAKNEDKVTAYAILADITLKTADSKHTAAAYKKALVYADNALSMDEKNVPALESKYIACFGLKSYISAMECAKMLLEIDPSNSSYKLKLQECEKVLKK